ncbi:PHB depolymerase family esterase (acetylxylan esterase A) [Seiridium cupressi]
MKFLTQFYGLLTLGTLGGASDIGDKQSVKRASLQQVSNFGDNTSKAKMYIYVPSNLATNPPIIVAIQYCTSTAQGYYSGSPSCRPEMIIVIYPESPYSRACWDVSSKSALTHNGGSDSNSIANMVTCALKQYKGDATKVFVTGSSSGTVMTNVMAATYPEMFAAGIVYSGVPTGCFVSSSGGVDAWNDTCAQGQARATLAARAQVVKDMCPGYNGTRPKMQIYHDSADGTMLPNIYNETIKQWASVFGYTENAPATTQSSTPQSGYTTYTFGDHLQGSYGQGVGHTVPIRGADDIKFFFPCRCGRLEIF